MKIIGLCKLSMGFWLVLLAAVAARAEIRDVIKSEDIDAALKQTKGEQALHTRPNFAIVVGVREGNAGPLEPRRDADAVVNIRRGSGRVTLGEKVLDFGPGDLIHIPRNTPYRIDPGGGRVEYLAALIFATGGKPPSGADRPIPDVLHKSVIDATFAKFETNQPLGSAGAYSMNHVIYAGRPRPYEAHIGCVDVVFLWVGTDVSHEGGEIMNAKEITPGEIRGNGVSGARTYDTGPGDLIVIPRNGAHHHQPTSAKFGYVLLKIWAE